MADMTLSELARAIGGQLTGDASRVVRGVASIDTAGDDEVTFLANPRYERYVESSRAAAVIVSKGYAGPGKSVIRTDDPYFAFRQAMVAFHGFRRHPFEGVDSRAAVDPSASLGPGARVAAFATVCGGAVIGQNAVIYPGVFVGPDCRIGDDCTLYPNVTLYDGTVLGDRVTIHAGSSIGHDGFGYATHGGQHHKIPQAGCVRIGDDVEVGACCAIDRATLGATEIGSGTKFSNLVAIGHGTTLGRHCLLVAQAGLAGSAHVGNGCVFGGQSGVNGHIHIGDGVKVAGRGGVTGDIPAGIEVGGMPAIPLRQSLRVWATLAHLPQMRSAIARVVREVRALKRGRPPKASKGRGGRKK